MAVKIGTLCIGPGESAVMIAEGGINHNGERHLLSKMMTAAAESGAQGFKVQKRTIQKVYTPEELAAQRASPYGTTNGDLKRQLELGADDYAFIARRSGELGLIWFASPWDDESVDFLEEFAPPCYKVASPCVTDTALLKRIHRTGRPVIMSTGMSTDTEVSTAIGILGTDNLVLLHTVSAYPLKPEDANLRVMDHLRRSYPGVPVGYSDHSVGPLLSVAAVARGACMIERHFTLDPEMFGSDQKLSDSPAQFAEMVRQVRIIETALGSPEKKLYDVERGAHTKLRRFK